MLRLVSVNLLRNPRRAILTTLAIAVSIFVLSVLLSLPAIAARVLRDRASSLRVICHSKAGMFYSLPEKPYPNVAAYQARVGGRPKVHALRAGVPFQTWRTDAQRAKNLFIERYRLLARAQLRPSG
jgi:hypothetical protein